MTFSRTSGIGSEIPSVNIRFNTDKIISAVGPRWRFLWFLEISNLLHVQAASLRMTDSSFSKYDATQVLTKGNKETPEKLNEPKVDNDNIINWVSLEDEDNDEYDELVVDDVILRSSWFYKTEMGDINKITTYSLIEEKTCKRVDDKRWELEKKDTREG